MTKMRRVIIPREWLVTSHPNTTQSRFETPTCRYRVDVFIQLRQLSVSFSKSYSLAAATSNLLDAKGQEGIIKPKNFESFSCERESFTGQLISTLSRLEKKTSH